MRIPTGSPLLRQESLLADKSPKPANFFDKLREMERRLNDRIDRRAGFDATQLNRTVAKLEELVAGLLTQVNGIFSGYITAGGTITASGNITTSSGDFFSPHGRATPVTTSYVAAYFNSDGRLGATPSGRRFKTNVRAKEYTLEQIMLANIIIYQLRALVGKLGKDAAPWEVGFLAEQLVRAGLSEFVVFNNDGRPFTVAYERLSVLAISGVQQLYRHQLVTNERIEQLEKRLAAAGL